MGFKSFVGAPNSNPTAREKGEVGRQINQFVDRILGTSLPEVTSAYEQRIRDLKLYQTEIEEQLHVCQGHSPISTKLSEPQ
jgi:hypothetical protein